MTTETAPRTCDGRTRETVAGAFGFVAVRCQRHIGLLVWTDTAGQEHRACAAHVSAMERRYPMSMPAFLHEDPTFIDHAPDATVEREYATYWTSHDDRRTS